MEIVFIASSPRMVIILLSPKKKSVQEQDINEAFGIGTEEKPENEATKESDIISDDEADDINGKISF